MKLNEEKRVARPEKILATLRRGKNVQNRQLRNLLGDETFAQFEDEWRQQQELREDLKDKPSEILEYEERLKAATFTYSKADFASRKRRQAAATKLFATAEAQFERLVEFLQEQIAGDHSLEMWLDRSVHYDASNVPAGSPDDFPCVVTSRSLRKVNGACFWNKQTKLQVKIGVVEHEIDVLTRDEVDELALVAKCLAAGQRLRNILNR